MTPQDLDRLAVDFVEGMPYLTEYRSALTAVRALVAAAHNAGLLAAAEMVERIPPSGEGELRGLEHAADAIRRAAEGVK